MNGTLNQLEAGAAHLVQGEEMHKNLALSIVASILFLASGGVSDEKPDNGRQLHDRLALSSDSLGAMVLDRKIKLMTRDGTYIEGKVIEASQKFIVLAVKKSESRNRSPEKKAVLATSDIGSVYLCKGGNIAVPIALGILGGMLGGGLGGSINAGGDEANYMGLFIGVPSGAVLGALGGRALVRKTVTISVLQPPQP